MGRKLGTNCGLSALALAAALSAAPGRASEPAKFSVDCPALPAELLSSLEARALADLAPYGRSDVHWQVTCRASEAMVDSYAGSDLVRQSRVPLSGEPKSWVEQILSFLHEVVPCADIRRPLATEIHASAESALPSKTLATPLEASRGTRTEAHPLLDPSLSLDTELWTPDALVLLGPTARLGLWVNRLVRIAPSLGAAWSSTRPSDIGVRVVAGGVDVNIGKRVWGSLGARLVWVAFDPSSQLGSTAKNRFEPELAAKVGVTFPLSNAAVSAALGLRAYSASHEVRVNGTPTLLVPLVAPLVSIEYRFAARD